MKQPARFRPLRSTPTMAPLKTPFPWRRFFIVAICLLGVFGVWRAGAFFNERSSINVTVAGESASFKTASEIQTVIMRQQQKIRLVIQNGTQTFRPSLSDIGVTFNSDTTLRIALSARSQGGADWVRIWQTVNVPLAISVDKKKLETYFAATLGAAFAAPVQPAIRYNSRIEEYELIAGQPGKGASVDTITEQLLALAEEPQQLTVQIKPEPVQPSVTELAATKTQDAATFRTRLRLAMLYQKKLVYFPEPDEIASWQYTQVNEDGTSLDIMYDKAKIIESIKTHVAKSLNELFGPNGTEIDRSQYELEIKNSDALMNDIVLALQNAQPFEKEIEVSKKVGQ